MHQIANSLNSNIDHLVVAAASLEEGIRYIERCLGVTPQQGGKHMKMGTHNSLLKLGDKTYLEVIAIDPVAIAPNRQRWFNLDDPEAYKTPCLITWIVRTENIYAAAAASNIRHGNIEQMSRGDMEWLLTVPEDGSMPYDGIAPLLIQWNTKMHPCDQLDDKGCKLLQLEAFHKESKTINEMLAVINFEGNVTIKETKKGALTHLMAHIKTAAGICRLI